jgi:hypothetical protein
MSQMGFLGAAAGIGKGFSSIGENMMKEQMLADRELRIEEFKLNRDKGRYSTETDPRGVTYQTDTLSGKKEVLLKPERQNTDLKQIMTPEGPRWARSEDAIGQVPVTQNGMSLTFPDGTSMQMGGTGGGFKVPSGYRLRDPRNPSIGLEPIPGGPADEMSPGDAAKASLIQQGITDARDASKMILRPDGSVDRVALTQMETGAPFTKGRSLYSLMYNSVEGKLRAESGAAVPEAEVKRIAKRFIPSLMDDDQTIRLKLQRLDEYLGSTLNKVDPTGRFNNRNNGGGMSHVSDDELLRALGVQR